jgi:hypothetical protein
VTAVPFVVLVPGGKPGKFGYTFVFEIEVFYVLT